MVLFDDVITQFRVADKYTQHPKNGLNYHAWDESRLEQWADPKTGQSPNLWSRSIGWYVMALVDVLEYLPINHPDRPYLVRILNRVSSGLVKYQDKKTGMWFQVTNLPNKKGNYLESSGTAMFSYAMAKGVNKGYLPVKFRKTAEKAFNGLIKYSTELNADSSISITKACGVAGLGGNPYRDGSFQYYINEPVRNDDPKVVGPFILAAIELAAKK
jgi:unsaturated rhamnogalacturonyl hydrolase